MKNKNYPNQKKRFNLEKVFIEITRLSPTLGAIDKDFEMLTCQTVLEQKRSDLHNKTTAKKICLEKHNCIMIFHFFQNWKTFRNV